MKVKLSTVSARALVFDIENRPLSYWYDGNPTAEITLIGWKWVGDHEAYSEAMTHKNDSQLLVEKFLKAYELADVVIGHNIRRHDLPILNAACIEAGLPKMKGKLTIDTLRDLVGWKDIPKSLEYLCELLECPFPKFHMTQHSWRKANRLEQSGIELAKQRVETDVRATEWVYQELLRRGMLTKPPRTWKP